MAVTAFQDLDLADRDREWDGAAAAVMQGSRGGVDLPDKDRDRVRSHLAKYYARLDETPPWED